MSEDRINSDPNYFWRFLHSKRQSSRILGEMLVNNVQLTDPQQIVVGFAKHFSSAYLPSTESPISITRLSDNSIINLSEIMEADIIKSCKALNANLTSGPDNIPAFLVRDCAHILAKPLQFIFNRCIQSGIFPNRWKTTNICPIFKNGNKMDIKNYRPISLLSNFSKVFEKAIINKLNTDIYCRISNHQHGFVKNRSTCTNLVSEF